MLYGKKKTFFPRTKFCPAKTRLFLAKRDFVRPKQDYSCWKDVVPRRTKSFLRWSHFNRRRQNFFRREKILSVANETFFARTRFFHPNQKGGFYGCSSKARSRTVASQYPTRSRCGGN